MVLENAGSMRPTYRDAVVRALGIGGSAARAPVIDACPWSGFQRRRYFFSTFPAGAATVPMRRPAPWDERWQPLRPAPMPPMQRSRAAAGQPPCAPAWQYRPQHLLARRGTVWERIAPSAIAGAVRREMPERLRPGWDAIAFGRQGGAAWADGAAAWLAEHGPVLGIRAPNVAERARAMGLAQYLALLNLTEAAMYDAQGNSFDKDALRLRLEGPLLQWLRGADYEHPVYLSPAGLAAQYGDLLAGAVASGCAAWLLEPAPFPTDLLDTLLQEGVPARPVQSRAPAAAATDSVDMTVAVPADAAQRGRPVR
jgi:hypothetical protein